MPCRMHVNLNVISLDSKGPAALDGNKWLVCSLSYTVLDYSELQRNS